MNRKFIDIARKTDDAYKIGEIPEGYIEYYPAYTDSETGTQVKFLQKKGTNILEIRWAGTNFSDHDGYQGFADVIYGWRTKAKVPFDKVDMEILSWLIPDAKNKGMRIYSYGDSLGGLNTGHTVQKYPYVESGMTNTSNIWETDTNLFFQIIMPLFSPYSKKNEYKGLAPSYHIRVHGELLGDTGLPANALTVERASTQGFTRLWLEETIKKYPILKYNPFFQLSPLVLGLRVGTHGSQGVSAHMSGEILTDDNGETFHPAGGLDNIQLYYDKYPHKIPEYIKGVDKVLDGDVIGGSKIAFNELSKETIKIAQNKKEQIYLKVNNTLIATQKEIQQIGLSRVATVDRNENADSSSNSFIGDKGSLTDLEKGSLKIERAQIFSSLGNAFVDWVQNFPASHMNNQQSRINQEGGDGNAEDTSLTLAHNGVETSFKGAGQGWGTSGYTKAYELSDGTYRLGDQILPADSPALKDKEIVPRLSYLPGGRNYTPFVKPSSGGTGNQMESNATTTIEYDYNPVDDRGLNYGQSLQNDTDDLVLDRGSKKTREEANDTSFFK